MSKSRWQNRERLGRAQKVETAAEVEGKHSNSEQNLAEKEHFII